MNECTALTRKPITCHVQFHSKIKVRGQGVDCKLGEKHDEHWKRWGQGKIAQRNNFSLLSLTTTAITTRQEKAKARKTGRWCEIERCYCHCHLRRRCCCRCRCQVDSFVHSSLSSLPPCHQHHIYFDLYPFYVSARSAVVAVIALAIFSSLSLSPSHCTFPILFDGFFYYYFGIIECLLCVREFEKENRIVNVAKMKFLAFSQWVCNVCRSRE